MLERPTVLTSRQQKLATFAAQAAAPVGPAQRISKPYGTVSRVATATDMPAPPPRPPGRPLDQRVRGAAIEATLDVIAERGVRRLTTAAVAERAGISKATMYRRWRSKEALVVDAVASLVSEIAIPD